MESKWVKYAVAVVLWAAVGGTLLLAHRRVRTHENELLIGRIAIEIADSTAHGQLVTREMVGKWISASEMAPVGKQARSFDLAALERLIARNGFVERVRASVDYTGCLHIDIRQRRPLFRLLVDGYDLYVTEKGYLFAAPTSASIYVPVVTGGYRPPFPPGFEGQLEELLDRERLQSDERIGKLEQEKYPFYRRERKNIEYNRETRRMRIRRQLLESREHFRGRVEELKAEKRERRRRYRYEQQQIQAGIDRVCARQEAERARQKKLEKNYQDFSNLITFVKRIDEDAFWRAEIVQLIASEAHSGALEVEFVPRSGRFTVRLGRLEETDEKLERVERFCREGLKDLGWDTYRTVSVAYRGQVVCSQ